MEEVQHSTAQREKKRQRGKDEKEEDETLAGEGVHSLTKCRKIIETLTAGRKCSIALLGWEENARGATIRKKIAEGLTTEGRKWISRVTGIAKETLTHGWVQHEGQKTEQGTMGMTRRV